MNKKRPRIFIVDDDVSFGKSLARLMRSVGFDVEVFVDAREFLKREIYTGTSCLILDLRMPGMTGPELQRELSRRNVLIPIVFLTALEDKSASVKAMEDGAVDFLLKPVDEESLFNAIDRALDQDVQIKKKAPGSRG